MSLSRKAGSTSVILPVFLQDSSSDSGEGLAGLVHNSSNLTCYYKRSDGTAVVAVTLATITTLGTYAAGGFKAVDNTNAPGLIEFHPPDAAMAAGAEWVVFYFRGATNLADTPVLVDLGAAVGAGGIDRASFAADTGLQTVRSGTAQGGTANTITLDAGASATDDIYYWQRVYITAGTGAGQDALIVGYVGATKVATIAAGWWVTPDNTSKFAIVPDALSFVGVWGGVAVTTNGTYPTVNVGAVAAPAAATVVAAVFAKLIETGVTFDDLCQAVGAALAGDVTGGGSVYAAIGNPGTTRLTVTDDGNGNRSLVLTL